jgi:hypothetical protein
MIDKKIFEEQVNEYRSLISETPLYKGLDKVLDSKELLEKVIERNKCISEDWDKEDFEDGYEGITVDSVDCVVMELFAEQLIKNLIEEGFIWNEENEGWTVPEKYRKTKFAHITGEQNELTNYGIIWDVLPMNYDTCIREMISDIIDEVMYDKGMMEY